MEARSAAEGRNERAAASESANPVDNSWRPGAQRRAGMSSWGPALRIARREVGRAKGRALMVVAMIGIPVAALAFVAVTYDTFNLSPDEHSNRTMGAAQATVRWPQDAAVHQTSDGRSYYPADRQQKATEPPGPAPAPTLDRLLALLPR